MSRTRFIPRLGAPIAALAAAAALSSGGCAAHVSPGMMAGSPDSCGLAVVVCIVDPNIQRSPELGRLTLGDIELSSRAPVDAGTIGSLDVEGPPIHSTSIAGVLVFPRLREGYYRIRSFLQERHFLERDNLSHYDFYRERSIFAIDPRSARDLTFHVATGGLTYVGVIVVRATFEAVLDEDSRRVSLESLHDRVQYRIEPDDARERDVWSTLLRWYRGTPWEAPIQERVHALSSRG